MIQCEVGPEEDEKGCTCSQGWHRCDSIDIGVGVARAGEVQFSNGGAMSCRHSGGLGDLLLDTAEKIQMADDERSLFNRLLWMVVSGNVEWQYRWVV